MSDESSENDVDFTIEKLKRKYLERREQLSAEKNPGGISHYNEPYTSKVTASPKSRGIQIEMRGYNRALRELFKAVTLTHPSERLDSDSVLTGSEEEDLGGDCTACPLLDTQAHYTETDVTLPSSLAGTPGSGEAGPAVGVAREERGRGGRRKPLSPLLSPSSSSPSGMGQVYQEMLLIYEQLRAERDSQQQWERELQDRESRLLQQQQALSRLRGAEDEVHTRILEIQGKHQQEMSRLQDLLRERTRENRRLKSSFDSVKELNDAMKKQLNELTDLNKRLESQSRKVQARLENLQRKHEYSMAQRGRENVRSTSAESRAPKQEKASSSKTSKSCVNPAPPRLTALLLDWVLDGQAFPPAAGDQRDPSVVSLHERCSKVLPLLVEQLQQASGSDPPLILLLLRFIYRTLRQLDDNTQPTALSSTLRRLGEEVSRPPVVRSTALQDPGCPPPRPGAPHPRTTPLYGSPCPHTRLLSTLIILRTVTQADVLAQALSRLHGELECEESRGRFLRHGGPSVLLALLRGGRGGASPHGPLDILLLLGSPSRFLSPFLEACSNEEFFRTAALLLRNPRLELPLLEKISILLQKLSAIRKNKRLFELSTLHLLLREIQRITDPSQTFLCLNLSSILINLK